MVRRDTANNTITPEFVQARTQRDMSVYYRDIWRRYLGDLVGSRIWQSHRRNSRISWDSSMKIFEQSTTVDGPTVGY